MGATDRKGDRVDRQERRQANEPRAALVAPRLVVESVSPVVDSGRFAAKAVAGWGITVEADIFGDGHDRIAAAVETGDGRRVPMRHVGNDRWRAEVVFEKNGPDGFTIAAWRDEWGTWADRTRKKLAAGQDVAVEMQEAALLIDRAEPARDGAAMRRGLLEAARAGDPDPILSDEAAAFMQAAAPKADLTRTDPFPVWVDRPRAAFSAWYELFPRSLGPEGRHGTFQDVIGHLDYVADLGFDVLYFPPIHPIGTTNRKGRNNALTAQATDVGSPYAVGSPEGGMDAVHPDLGTLDDFDTLVAAARDKGLEIALDIALNASPDHPWIAEHPDWFEHRPDGTIKHAENPPKKYEDIVNFRYYRGDAPNAPFWEAIRDLFVFWIGHGVTIFRVDNPHTKPFPFWEWIIAEIRRDHPDAIFLSEAFTRPKIMKRLAKIGFNQSYTYYTWRNTKSELADYVTELSQESCRHYMRPNFFTNTPDINPWFNHDAGRPGFRIRTMLAGSLVSNWGLYSGFEFCEADWLPPKDEYRDSEKYELKKRDFDAPGHIKDDVRLVNRIRRDNPAMQDFTNIRFLPAFDDRVLYYGRFDREASNYLLFHVLVDPENAAEFGFEVPLWEFDLPPDGAIAVQDAIHGNRFTWHGQDHSLRLDPQDRPYAIWKLFPEESAR